ncbi:hypothetical protein [Acetobacter indonesiensis]|uniref:hypothetical protein n=1 Tax=Acetobacter indonesiensis TaxID=104101 RepID=UPI0020A51308|nr:hypothetical protein [Acetobacter indonesiensis]MCP1232025.1 hypothetical protein [Acetobacter indonesiensis]
MSTNNNLSFETQSTLPSNQSYVIVSLRFPDERSDIVDLDEVNEVLRTIGVRVSTVDIPPNAKPILKKYETEALSDSDKSRLIELFNLTHEDLLEEVRLAGRTPTVAGGGVMTRDTTGNVYPNVIDMRTVTQEDRKYFLDKYGRLHVNSANDGTGIDEVMTVVSGGPFRWAFTLKDGSVARFTIERISPNGKAVRVSYPGLGMHAGIVDPEYGIMISFAHGPQEFVMRYDSPNTPHAELLGTNPWINYSSDMPKVLDKVEI